MGRREGIGVDGNIRPAHLPRVITSVSRGLELGLVLVQGQSRGVVAVRVGDDGPAVVGSGPKGRAHDVVVEG